MWNVDAIFTLLDECIPWCGYVFEFKIYDSIL